MTREGVAGIADRVLRPALKGAVQNIAIREDDDWSGEPSLYVDVVIDSGAGSVDGDLSIELRRMLSTELLASGEQRFAYLNVRKDGEQVDDEQPPGM